MNGVGVSGLRFIYLPGTPVPVQGDSEHARHTETKCEGPRSALPPPACFLLHALT